jgi:hypothetical protein
MVSDVHHPRVRPMASALARAKPSASTKASSQHLIRPGRATCLRQVATCLGQSKQALKRGLSQTTARVVLVAMCWRRTRGSRAVVAADAGAQPARKLHPDLAGCPPGGQAGALARPVAQPFADTLARACVRAGHRGHPGARDLSLCMSILAICSAAAIFASSATPQLHR